MKLKIIQNSIGRYNLLGKEATLSARIGIVDEEGKVIKVGKTEGEYPKDISALLEMSFGEDENLDWKKEEINDSFNDFNIPDMLSINEDSISTKWSTGDCYESNRDLFIKVLSENFEQIRSNFLEEKNKKIDKEVLKLLSQKGKAYTEEIDEFI